ncbi:Piriformospora indica-insensitive protein 2 [Nymphaea thermarum]|nr:Piriformospora indica-insensitive protein 2 [Nymphaea thermarum]
MSTANNRFSGNITHTFRQCSNLTDLVLAGNNLSGEIPGYVGVLPLVTLELSQNEFHGKQPDGLWTSKTLLEITLSNNMLTGGISPEIAIVAWLERLMPDNNLLEGPIPREIGELKNLN